MQVSFPISALRKATGEEARMLKSAFKQNSYDYDNILSGRRLYPDTHRLQFKLDSIPEDMLVSLWSFANKHDMDKATMNSITRWREAIRNPMDTPVPSLTAMYRMLREVVATSPYRWVMRKSPEGYYLPYLVTDIQHHPRTRYSSEHCSISMMAGLFFSSDEYTTEEKANTESQSVSFYQSDIYEQEEQTSTVGEVSSSNMYDLKDASLELGNDEDDTDDEDEDDLKVVATAKKKKTPAKRKARQKNLLQILADDNIFLPTEEMMNDFIAHTDRCIDVSKRIGHQFTCTTEAYVTNGRWYGGYHIMHDEGVPFRLVVDMRGIPAGIERQHNTTHWGTRLLPYHPYVRCYNLTKYSYVQCHVASMVEYQYDKNILKNMIISDQLRSYLNAIIGGSNVFKDIIAGKSGGMIILATGAPGLGKTLTAETYAEQMELPLYQIQSSQLGIDVDTIEKNLTDALRRAERWGAVLLIDECDTYVRKREKDIEQNCIVGVWLRLLEYYNGIMFLTTNQHDVIDGAIMSRCSAHIKYEMPDEKDRKAILLVHAKIQEVKVSDTEAASIAKKYVMSGRDLRNLLKNINKVYRKDSKPVQLTSKMVETISPYLPSIK